MAISLIRASPKKLFTLGMLSKQNRSILFPIWSTYIGYKSAIMNKGPPLWLAHHNIILFTLWTFSKGRICSPKLQEGSLQHRLQKWFFYVTMSPLFIPLIYYKLRPHMLTSTIENKNPSQPMRWDNMHRRGQFFSFWWMGGWVGGSVGRWERGMGFSLGIWWFQMLPNDSFNSHQVPNDYLLCFQFVLEVSNKCTLFPVCFSQSTIVNYIL
jgi:hypothetical protein